MLTVNGVEVAISRSDIDGAVDDGWRGCERTFHREASQQGAFGGIECIEVAIA